MNHKLFAISVVILCTAFTSSAQIFYKLGADSLAFDFFKLITNYNLIIGLTLYGLGAILFLTALKKGELSVLYPIFATSYVWVTILSFYFFGEIINIHKVLGIITIMIGVTFVGWGSE